MGTLGILYSYFWFRRVDARRAAAQAAAREADRQWLAVVEAAGDGTWEFEAGTRTMRFSKRWRTMLGYGEAELADTYGTWVAQIHPEDLARAEAMLGTQAAGRSERTESEYRLRRKDGSYCWVLCRVGIVGASEGGPGVRVVGIQTDISEQRARIEELRESREYARFFWDHATDPMVAYLLPGDSRATQFVEVNEAACTLLGYDRAALLARSPIDFEKPPPPEFVARRLQELRQKRKALFETELLRADGGLVPVEVSAELMDFRGQPTVLANIRDISGRVASHNKQRKDAAQAQLLLELYERSPHLTEAQLLEGVVDAAVALSDSAVGFLHWLAADPGVILHTTLHRRAREQGAETGDLPSTLRHESFWAECARERRVVVRNDGPVAGQTGGLPPGSAPLRRFLCVPVIEAGLVQIVLGVGGKAVDYTEVDEARLQLVAAELQKILARRRAERELAEKEQRYRSLFEGSPLPMWIFDRETLRFLDVNAAAVRHYGYTREEFLRLSLRDVRPPEDVPVLEKVIRGVPAIATDARVWRHRKKSGEEIHVEVTSGGLTWQGREARCALLVDTTQRRRMEEALRESLAHLRAVVETTPGCVKLVASDGTVLSMNPSGLAYVEADSADDVIGRNVFTLIAPEFRAAYREFHERVCRGEGATCEFQIETLKGRRRWMESHAVPFSSKEDGRYAQLAITHDVTERKAAAAQLAYHASVLANVPAAVISTDRSLRILSWSRGAEEIYGWTEAEALGRHVDQICRTEFVGVTALQARSALVRDGVWRGRLQQQHRSGCRVLVQAHVAAIRDPSGAIIGGVTINSDITNSWETEQALKKSELSYREIFNASNDAIFVHDAESGQVLDVNKAMLRIYGFESREQYLADPLQTLVEDPAYGLGEASRRLRLAVEEGPQVFEWRTRRKSGEPIWVEVSLRSAVIGGRRRVLAVSRDITERKRAELALRESEAKFLQIYQQAPVMISITAIEDGTYVDVNDFALGIAGYARDEVIGRNAMELGWIGPRERARIFDELRRHGRVRGLELEFRAKDGRKVVGLVSGAVIEIGGRPCLLSVTADLTEHKRMEHALLASEGRFRTLFDSAPIGIVEEDFAEVRAGFDELRRRGVTDFAAHFDAHPAELRSLAERIRILHANERAAEILAVDAGQMSAGKISAGMLAESWQVMRDEFAALAAGRRTFSAQMPMVNARGEQKLLELSLVVPPGSEETLSRVVVIFSDITSRLRTEADLRKLSRAVEQSPVTVVITDRMGVIDYANPQFFRVSGYAPEEVLGKSTRVLKSGAHPPEYYAQLWSTICAGRDWRGELCNRRKDGTLYWEDARISPVLDERGVITHFLAVKEDITLRRETMLRLKEQAALLDVTQDAIVVVGLGGEVRFWNRGAEQTYGYSAAEAVGGTVFALILDADANPGPEAILREIIEKGEWNGEMRQRSKTGGALVANVRAVLLRDTGGDAYSILLTSSDITEAKRLEAQYLRAQRLESLGALSSGVAHDLNNVLTPILVATDMLRPIAHEPHDREIVQLVADSARRGVEIVQQLLLFGRGSDTPRIAVDVGGVLRGLDRMMEETFPKNLTIRVHWAKDLWTVMADRTQLHQVLLNLCVNARDAMPGGGGLTCAGRNVHVDAEYASRHLGGAPGPHVALSVADTGTGIEPAIIDRIFDPFFTTKPAGKGTGLGLATVIGIVKSHGGFLHVDSQVGQGTTFTVFLPATIVAKQPAGETADLRSHAGRGELVLVVDDEMSVRQVLERSLARSGYRVITAAHGAEALGLFTQHLGQVRLVITDVMMPIMDGVQMLHALHQLDQAVPAIAMSGLRQPQEELERLFGPRVRFLAKPFVAQDVLRAVREMIEAPAPSVRPPGTPSR